ncbi:GDCCVxC domain-containing (seleno)protein [Paenarthrobacter sp. Z7-10]|uniref:GDCCVxC domain-containing (seleno)protein n=1 Tax=Paenarthrobacter sp. Z7-10 TaxID=2787635 RepID=UPI002E77CD2C|nr:GDCCVxC domain-containing (seleno)protein [Paenarthrobacter sp. Z7-10]
MSGLQLTSTLTCPDCGNRELRDMPEDACVYFYRCEACGGTSKPLPGDCCVFCSYGDAACPPLQTPM